MHRDEDWWENWRNWSRIPRKQINGVARERLEVGSRGDVEITFLGEDAGYRNSLFVYRLGDHGRFEDVRLLWGDTSETVSARGWSHGPQSDGPLDRGDSIRLSDVYDADQLAPGQEFGLLLVANGFGRNPEALFSDAEGFRLIDRRTGEEAGLDTPRWRIRLVHEGEQGDIAVRGRLLFTTDPRDDGGWRNPLNPDGREHVLSHPGAEPGQTELYFEDQVYRRGDYNDLRLLVDTEPEDTGVGCPIRLDADGLDDGLGVVARGEQAGDRAGYAVVQIGDFDGDGFGDVAVGAPLAGEDGQGTVYILFGRGEDIPGELTLDGEGGYGMTALHGAAAGDRLGAALASAGDVNGDGFDDLVIGATGLDGLSPDSGGAYLLLGGSRPDSGDIEAVDAARLVRIEGVNGGDETGIAVAGGGDINGDGFDDLLIGARLAEPDYARYSSGVSYLLFGGADGVSGDLSALDGNDGVRLPGLDRFDQSGRSVAILGDIDGDGFDDLAVGAPDADPGGRTNAGEVYVIYGTDEGFPATLDPSAPADGGFLVAGADPFDFAGFAVSGAGDVNGDGFDDLLIGAYARDTAGGEAAGAAYLVFGSEEGHPDGLDLGDLDGSNGFAMFGLSPMSGTGRAVAAAGDVNGDGFDDFLVGARYADPEGVGGAGEAYLIYGHDGPFDAVLDLGSLEENGAGCRLIGTTGEAYAGFSLGGPGDIDGDGFDDLVIGAPATVGGEDAGTAFAVFGGERFTATVASLTGDPTTVV